MGQMVNVMGLLDAMQSTMASLVGRVTVVDVETQRHTDTALSINGRFDQLMGLVQGCMEAGVCRSDHYPWGQWACRRR
jgi:hypothetical protein